MTESPKELWEHCLAFIRQNVGEHTYKTWFRPTAFVSYDEAGKMVVLGVPSPFVYEYLDEKFPELLRKSLDRYFGKGTNLAYKILADKENKQTLTVESEPKDKTIEMAPTTRANQSPSVLDAAAPQKINPNLKSSYTFDNYIEGNSNRLPRSIGMSIAEHPTKPQFNPLFVYGPSGCGKTHLINAIGVRVKQLYPQTTVLYISAYLFQSQFTSASLKGNINDFINFYQQIDLLIIDDIQEWIGKEKTQQAFFHIFNHLFLNGKRIILASDRPPVDLKGMPDRLLTRFSCGIVAELEKPNIELCVDIIHSLMRKDGTQLPEDVVKYIAETENGSVRDLQGTINSLLAYSINGNCPIDLNLARKVVKRTVKVNDEPLSINEIVKTVCQHYNITIEAVNSSSRKREIVTARQVSMYLANKYTGQPASRIGRSIGGRDHSTVIHSCTKVGRRMMLEKEFKADVKSIEMEFGVAMNNYSLTVINT
jgi:chromosomal replication initiator protein